MKYFVNEISKDGVIAVDDTILVKGTPATAGSKMLENFTPLFSAEAVERLENQVMALKVKQMLVNSDLTFLEKHHTLAI